MHNKIHKEHEERLDKRQPVNFRLLSGILKHAKYAIVYIHSRLPIMILVQPQAPTIQSNYKLDLEMYNTITNLKQFARNFPAAHDKSN